MRQPKMHDAIRRHYEKARVLGKALGDEFGEEEIHHFRVEVKKLRALLRLASSASHASIKPRWPQKLKTASIKPQLPQKLKTAYAMIGIIRNLQLLRKGLVEMADRVQEELPASCLAVLDGRIGTAINVTSLYLKRGRPFDKQRRKWLAPVAENVLDAAGEEFFRLKRQLFTLSVPAAIAEGAPAGVPEDQELHIMRKAMKDVQYVWPYLSKRTIYQAQSDGALSKEMLQRCTGLLGDFRDVFLRLRLLQDKDFLLSTGPQARKFLEMAGNIWLQDKQIILGQLDKICPHAPVSPTAAVKTDDEGTGEKKTGDERTDDERATDERATHERTGENPLTPINLNAASYELHVD